jgi:hypothetical protein
MANEHALIRATTKMAHADRLMNDETLVEAFKGLEDAYLKAWRSTHESDVAAREKLFIAINIVAKVRNHLTALVANGKLAKAELDEIARTAERRKRFGII